jgi:hypothetical protein
MIRADPHAGSLVIRSEMGYEQRSVAPVATTGARSSKLRGHWRKSFGQRLEHLELDLGRTHQERLEVMRADRQEPGGRCQRHRCRPRPAQDQRQLAEEVSRRQRRDEAVLSAYLSSAFDQDEERVRDGGVFVDQGVTRWKIDLVSELRHRDTITFRATREERYGREQFSFRRAAKRHPQSLSRGGQAPSSPCL